MIYLKKILFFLFRVFTKYNLTYGMFLVCLILTKRLSGKRKYRILVLSKSIFLDDVLEINKNSSELQFLLFPRLLISEIVKKYTHDFDLLNDSTYYPILNGTKEQKKIFILTNKLFILLKRYLKFDAIFAGNYVYVSQQEFFSSANQNNVPVIILYKEGIGASVKYSEEISKKMYKGKIFKANFIMFYNNAVREMLLKGNIPGLDFSKTEVVGMPRLDIYFNEKKIKEEDNFILLFSFDPNIKANRFVDDKNLIKDYIKLGEQFHFIFIKYCIENPNYKLVIKTKSDPGSKLFINDLLKKMSIKKLPENIKVISKGNPRELIYSARYVAGSLSTSLIESIILDKPIICPNFRNLIKIGRLGFFDDYPNSVNYINSIDELSDLMSGKKQLNMVDKISKKSILGPILYKTDGKSSIRVKNKIINIIKQNKNGIK